MTKEQIKQEIREYFVEQYNYCLRALEQRFIEYAMVIGPRTITRTTKVFSYKKYLKQLAPMKKAVKTTLDWANSTWAKDNDGSPIYKDENGYHYIFDRNKNVEFGSSLFWEVDVDKWLEQKYKSNHSFTNCR